MSLERVYRFQLEPTATYRLRSCLFLPTSTLSCDGVLTMTIAHAKSFKIEQDVYGIEEIEPEQIGTRKFVLVNLTDDEQEQPYEVTTGAPQFRRCSCDGGKMGFRKASCKHKDALLHLIEANKLPQKQLQGA